MPKRSLAELLSLPDGALVDSVEAARVLALPVKSLENKRWRGDDPPARKLGALVRYAMGDLRRYRGDPPASADAA